MDKGDEVLWVGRGSPRTRNLFDTSIAQRYRYLNCHPKSHLPASFSVPDAEMEAEILSRSLHDEPANRRLPQLRPALHQRPREDLLPRLPSTRRASAHPVIGLTVGRDYGWRPSLMTAFVISGSSGDTPLTSTAGPAPDDYRCRLAGNANDRPTFAARVEVSARQRCPGGPETYRPRSGNFREVGLFAADEAALSGLRFQEGQASFEPLARPPRFAFGRR